MVDPLPCACGFPRSDLMLWENQYSRKCPYNKCFARTPNFQTKEEATASWNRMVCK